jgi:hypothetical protein
MKRERRRAVGTHAPILVEAQANARWLLVFVNDQFACGRHFRVLYIVDDVTHVCLAGIPDISLHARRLVRDLATLVERPGKSGMIVTDNGTEDTSHATLASKKDQEVQCHCIAGASDAEWLRRVLQRSNARRGGQRKPVPRAGNVRSSIAE